MRKIVTLLLIIVISPIFPDEIDLQNLRPIFALEENGPYMPISGYNAALAVLYDNGLLLYSFKPNEKEPVFIYRILSQSQIIEVKELIEKFAQRHFFKSVTDNAQSTWVTDGTYILIYMDTGRVKCSLKSYGLRIAKYNDNGFYKLPDRPDRMKDISWKLYSYLVSLTNEKGNIWTPKSYKIDARRFENANEQFVIWPSQWSTPNVRIVKDKGDNLKIIIDSSVFSEVKTYLSSKRYFLINNERYFLMPIEPIFEGSDIWGNWNY